MDIHKYMAYNHWMVLTMTKLAIYLRHEFLKLHIYSTEILRKELGYN